MSTKFYEDLWISDDGTYGNNYLMLVDTSKWSEEDWLDFEEASDNDKWDLAIEIGEKYGDL